MTQNSSATRYVISQVLFWLHLPIALPPFLFFFIPSLWWPARIEWHFFYTLFLFAMYYAWGLIWTLTLKDKAHATCALTTLTQRVRGYKMFDKRNYEHSFVKEFLAIMHWHIKPDQVTRAMLIATLVSGLFLFLKWTFGIVIY